jgi:hypothetical protein
VLHHSVFVGQSRTKSLLKLNMCGIRIFYVSPFCFIMCCVCETMKLSSFTSSGYRFTGFFLNIFTSQQYQKCEKHCSGYIFGRYLVPVWTNCRLSWLRLLQCSSLFTCEFHINIGHDCLIPNCYLFINMKIFPSDSMLYYYYYSWSSTVL